MAGDTESSLTIAATTAGAATGAVLPQRTRPDTLSYSTGNSGDVAEGPLMHTASRKGTLECNSGQCGQSNNDGTAVEREHQLLH